MSIRREKVLSERALSLSQEEAKEIPCKASLEKDSTNLESFSVQSRSPRRKTKGFQEMSQNFIEGTVKKDLRAFEEASLGSNVFLGFANNRTKQRQQTQAKHHKSYTSPTDLGVLYEFLPRHLVSYFFSGLVPRLVTSGLGFSTSSRLASPNVCFGIRT